IASRILAIASGSKSLAVLTSIARSAPMANPTRSCSIPSTPPILTTRMSPSPWFSLIRSASSSAIASKGLTANFTPSGSRPEPSARRRIFVSGSGTRFSGTRIFTQPSRRSLWELGDGLQAHPPHPNPLPWGEGAIWTGLRKIGASEVHERLETVLPLPKGEGWGEGDQPSRPSGGVAYAMSFQLPAQFKNAGATHPTADAHGDQAVTPVAALELVHKGDRQ